VEASRSVVPRPPGLSLQIMRTTNNIFGNFAGARYNGAETPIDMENNWWTAATGPTVASNPEAPAIELPGRGAANIDYVPFRTAVIPDTDGDGLLDACDTVIKVRPSNLQTWQMQHAHCNGGVSTGSSAFVTGPGTPPLGTGSLRFTIGLRMATHLKTIRYPGLDTVMDRSVDQVGVQHIRNQLQRRPGPLYSC